MEQALYESSPQVKIPHISAAILQLVVERRAWLPNMGENFLAILQSCSCDTVRPDPLPKENKFSHQPIFFDCEGAGREGGFAWQLLIGLVAPHAYFAIVSVMTTRGRAVGSLARWSGAFGRSSPGEELAVAPCGLQEQLCL